MEPESTDQIVQTAMGEVDMDPTPESDLGTQQTGTSEEQPAVRSAQPIRIGDAEYTLEQLQDIVGDVGNVREMRRYADERNKEAKRMREEADRLMNDPEIQELMRTRQVLQAYPQLAQEWRAMWAWMNGKGPQPPTTQSGPFVAKLQAIEQRLEQAEFGGHLERAKGTIAAFLDQHNKIPGEQPWTQDSPEFVALYDEFESETPDGYADFGSWYWAKYGPELVQKAVGQGKTQAASDITKKIQAGQRAAKAEIGPAPHREVPYEPDPLKPGFDDEMTNAISDPRVWENR